MQLGEVENILNDVSIYLFLECNKMRSGKVGTIALACVLISRLSVQLDLCKPLLMKDRCMASGDIRFKGTSSQQCERALHNNSSSDSSARARVAKALFNDGVLLLLLPRKVYHFPRLSHRLTREE